MLLFDPQSWRLDPTAWKRWHRKWFWGCAVVALAAGGWYAVFAIGWGTLPGGSSLPGLVAGSAAGLLFLYLFAFALRKLPVFRLWFSREPTKKWLAQHIWLGLLTFPLVALHSGLFTRWGGVLTMILLVVYLAVMCSGIWGLWMQQRLPHRLLQEAPDEVIAAQIPELSEQLRTEAELLVLATCGPPADGDGEGLKLLRKHENLAAVRAARTGKGSGLLSIVPAEPVADTEPLRQYFRSVVEPYLRPETSPGSALRLRARMDADFRALRQKINPDAHPVVDALEDLCERRRQFDQQALLHNRLHVWIAFHLSLSAILVVLVVWHAVSAVWYW